MVEQGIRKLVVGLLSRSQPSAWELVEHVERAFGLKARWEIESVLKILAIDPKLTHLQRSYLSSVLEMGELSQALKGEEAPRKHIESTVDELLRKSSAYRSSDQFQEMVDFMARFRKYSLIHPH
jgi:hypothetical protein